MVNPHRPSGNPITEHLRVFCGYFKGNPNEEVVVGSL